MRPTSIRGSSTCYQQGITIGPALAEIGDDEDATAIQGPAEAAVLDLLEGVRSSEYLERVT